MSLRNLYMRRGNTRTLKNNELKSARANSVVLDSEQELAGMERCERDQTSRKDTFWGIDFETKHKLNDQRLMHIEFLHSAESERVRKVGVQHQAWEVEYQVEGQNQAYAEALKELETRNKYMHALFRAGSSEIVYKFDWDRTHLPASQLHAIPKGKGDGGGGRGGADETLAVINPQHIGQQVMFHLEGIQQARALSLDDQVSGGPRNSKSQNSGSQVRFGGAGTLGPLLRGRATTPGIAESKLMSLVESKGGAFEDSRVLAASRKSQQQQQPEHSRSFLGAFAGFPDPTSLEFGGSSTVAKPVVTEAMKVASEAYDGHPYFKWDQELILREVFNSLDTSNRGVLYPADVARIASSSQLQYLLSFTVFGSWVKRRKWVVMVDALFGNVMDSSVNLEDSTASVSVSSPNLNGASRVANAFACTTDLAGNNYININKWFLVALAFARESNKPLRQIRTETEHLELLTHDSNYHSLEGSDVSFAARARRQQSRCERDAQVSARATVGDVVWALHNGGVKWMPCIIEAINSDLTWNLKYPLSQMQLRAYRKKAKGSEILTGKIISSELRAAMPSGTISPSSAWAEEGKSGPVGAAAIYVSHLQNARKAAVINAVLSAESVSEGGRPSQVVIQALNSILEYV